jgi:hypothetical protein
MVVSYIRSRRGKTAMKYKGKYTLGASAGYSVCQMAVRRLPTLFNA